jgi:dTDP-glucose pyrophosphorylase
MKILIPMAGEGSRFASAGYTFPKPLIDVEGKPMIERVVENFSDYASEFIFLVRKEHLEKYPGMRSTLHRITKGRFRIVEVDRLTEGAACTALLAEEYIDRDEDLLIANSDQILKCSMRNFGYLKTHSPHDGIVFCFNATHPKWSFVEIGDFPARYGSVIRVAEKEPISDIATCGVYWYRKGSDFVKAAKQMISKNIRVNNEFYIAPVYNELIGGGGTVIPFFVDEMHGIGTPEDLNAYLNRGDKR